MLSVIVTIVVALFSDPNQVKSSLENEMSSSTWMPTVEKKMKIFKKSLKLTFLFYFELYLQNKLH
jgi:hypothetical protein